MTETKALVRIDPQYLIQKAVEANASIETLERLVALAKDVREVQAREAWHEAMAEFQRRCPSIKKTNTAQIATAKGYYSYKYAALDEIMETIRPLLGELGLSVSWSSRVEPQRVVVACRIAHALGYSENSGEISMPVPDSQDRSGGNPAQRVGSALTYARRYSLLQVTGLAPEDDDDAQGVGKPGRYAKPESPVGPTETATPSPSVASVAPAGDLFPSPGDPTPTEKLLIRIQEHLDSGKLSKAALTKYMHTNFCDKAHKEPVCDDVKKLTLLQLQAVSAWLTMV